MTESNFVPPVIASRNNRYTEPMEVLKGTFSISDSPVPYFQASMELSDLVSDLKLVEELPKEHTHKWSIEELFQRDIDWDRVKEEIVQNYLSDRDRLTFFNALTVALLPISSGVIQSEYSNVHDFDAPLKEPFNLEEFEVVRAGGIEIASMKNYTTPVQYIRWDKQSVFAATIDGQHRLAALKELINNSRINRTTYNSRIPVIFLVLDEKVGFKIAEHIKKTDDNPLLTVVRSVFIDLNKHASNVSQARQILLDDQDLAPLLTRQLIASKASIDDGNTIPLGLLNWQNDTAKFDTGPYLTSIISLYSFVNEILGIRYPEDSLDKDDVIRFARSIEGSLSMSGHEITESEKSGFSIPHSFYDYVIRSFEDEEDRPINKLPMNYLQLAVKRFEKIYREEIVGVFKNFTPYSELWKLSSNLGGVDGSLSEYLSESEKGKDIFKNELAEDEFNERIALPIKELSDYKKGKWPFLIVWQKALLKATRFNAINYEILTQDSSGNYYKKWFEYINALYDSDLFSLRAPLDIKNPRKGDLWDGISKNPGTGTIAYSKASTARIFYLLTLGWYVYNTSDKNLDVFYQLINDPSEKHRFVDAGKMINSLVKSFKASVIISDFDGEAPENDSLILSASLNRLKEVLNKTASASL